MTELIVAERREERALARELQELDGSHRSASRRHLKDVLRVDDLTRGRDVVDASEGDPLDMTDDGRAHSSDLVAEPAQAPSDLGLERALHRPPRYDVQT